MFRRLSLVLVGLAVLALSGGALAGPPPASLDFVRTPEIQAATLSPSGERLAYAAWRDGHKRIHIVDLDRSLTPVQQIDVGDFQVLWIRWTSETRLLISFYIPPRFEDGTIYFPAARTVATNTDGSDAVIMFGGETRLQQENIDLSGVVSMLPNDPEHVIMAARRRGDLDLWRLNVMNGEAERIGIGAERTIAWRVDSLGEPILRIDSNRRGTVLTIMAPDDDGRGWDRIAQVRETDQRDFQPLATHADPGRLYVVARPFEADRASVYVYDTRAREYINQISAHSEVDVTGAIVSSSTGEFLGTAYWTHRVQFDLVDQEAQAHLEALNVYFGGESNVVPIDGAARGDRWLIYVSAPQDAGSFHVYDMEAREAMLIGEARPWIRPEQLSPMEIVPYQARDGRELFGYLTLPQTASVGPPPLIVMPHGGPEMRDHFDYNPQVQFLASRGYAVFQPNFRGSSGFGREFTEAGYRQWGAAMQNDISDGVDHLAAAGRIDGERVCIYGGSYGGYAALAGATLTPDRYRCAIARAGVSDLRDFMQAVRRDRARGNEEYDYWVTAIGDPRRDRDRLDSHSPLHLVDAIQVPILLIHGAADGIVPVEQSRDMAEALDDAGLDYDYLEVRGAGHSFWDPSLEAQALRRIEDFLDRHMPATP